MVICGSAYIFLLAEQILWYNTRRNSAQMKNVLNKLVDIFCQVKFGKEYMAPESEQRLQAMSHNLMMGFETKNAHIM